MKNKLEKGELVGVKQLEPRGIISEDELNSRLSDFQKKQLYNLRREMKTIKKFLEII